jgi:hypothetical protein
MSAENNERRQKNEKAGNTSIIIINKKVYLHNEKTQHNDTKAP